MSADEEIVCPHLDSMCAKVFLHDIKQFKNHAATVHNISMWSSRVQHTRWLGERRMIIAQSLQISDT